MAVDLLIDGDPLIYSCGFVAERRKHLLEWRDVTPEGDVIRRASFDAAWRRDRFVELVNLADDEYISSLYSIPYPFSHAAQALRTTIEGIENNVHPYLEMSGLTPGKTLIFLTGGVNFRHAIATIKGYKANRSDDSRPYWYTKLREYMVDRYGAIVTDGIEADDEVSIRQWAAWNADDAEHQTIICTIDKDLRMVPGHHYHTKDKTALWQGEGLALRAFYLQLLSGDSTDNIPGCHKIGPGKAEKILANSLTEGQMYLACLETYEKNFDTYPEHHAPHISGADSLNENAQLLWMLRSRGPDGTWPAHRIGASL